MAKLSDIFLHILGNSLQGAGGLTPEVQAELALRQQGEARQNLSTLADVNQNYNQSPPGFIGPQPQGSFTPSSDTARLVGMTPGTTLSPVQRSSTFAVPNLKTGTLSTQTVPVQRGGSVSEVNPFSAALMGQQKNILDQAKQFETNAQTNLNNINMLLSKSDPSIAGQITQSIAQGLLPPNMSAMFRDPSIANQIQNEFAIYKQNKAQATQYRNQGMALLGGGSPAPTTPPGGAGGTPGGGSPLLGHIHVKNLQTGQTGYLPQANFDQAKYQQIQ